MCLRLELAPLKHMTYYEIQNLNSKIIHVELASYSPSTASNSRFYRGFFTFNARLSRLTCESIVINSRVIDDQLSSHSRSTRGSFVFDSRVIHVKHAGYSRAFCERFVFNSLVSVSYSRDLRPTRVSFTSYFIRH